MGQDVTPIGEIIPLLANSSPAALQMHTETLLQRYQGDELRLTALKQFYKAWGIPFAGDRSEPLLLPVQYPKMPHEIFGRYLKKELYTKVYALCRLAYSFEMNGIPEEQATKLCTLFNDEQALLTYLAKTIQSAQKSSTPVHDACLFTLPDFQAPGFWDPETGCKFEIFQQLAKQGDNLLRQEFKQLLPSAFELQQRVVAARKMSHAKKTDQSLIKALIVEITALRKRHDQLDQHKARLSNKSRLEYETLTNTISEMLCELAALSSGKLLKDLSLIELFAFYEQYKVDTEAAYSVFLNHGIPPKFFAEFKQLDRSKAGINLPDIMQDGNKIGHPGYYLMKVPVAADELQAARAACFGKLTRCCQSLSGEAGHECVKHGLTSPNGGFYVLCQGDSRSPRVSDPVIAQSWTWRSQHQAIVFDSIEIANKDTPNKKRVKDFYYWLGKTLVLNQHTQRVVCGANSGISKEMGISGIGLTNEIFIDYQGYCDSTQQKVIFDLTIPHYFYDLFEECRNKTKMIIQESANNPDTLRHNKSFLQILNWTLLENKTDSFQEISAAFSGKPAAVALTNMIQAIRTYHQKQDVPSVNALLSIMDGANLLSHDGVTPIFIATKAGDVALCLKLLESGANIDAQNNHGDTPLFIAAQAGLHTLGQVLIDNHATLTIKDKHQNTLLHRAAEHGNTDFCSMLIQKGIALDPKNEEGDTPLHRAANKGHQAICEQLLAQGAKINISNNVGETPLLLAVRAGHRQICNLLIQHGALLNVRDKNGYSLLHIAAEAGSTDICLQLIHRGMDVNLKNANHDTPLSLAAEKGHSDTCLMLIQQKAHLNEYNLSGFNPLLLAIQRGHLETCRVLIQQGADLHAQDGDGNNALLLAALFGHCDICLMLIQSGLPINATNQNHFSALLWAVEHGHTATCVALLKEGADINIKDKYNVSPLYRAAEKGYVDICLLLLKSGAALDPLILKALSRLNDNDIHSIINSQLTKQAIPLENSLLQRKELRFANTSDKKETSIPSCQADAATQKENEKKYRR